MSFLQEGSSESRNHIAGAFHHFANAWAVGLIGKSPVRLYADGLCDTTSMFAPKNKIPSCIFPADAGSYPELADVCILLAFS